MSVPVVSLDDIRGWLLATDESTGEENRESLTARVIEAVVEQSVKSRLRRFDRVINATGVVLHTGLGDDKYLPCPMLREKVAAGHLGRKSGKGFYDYE